MLLGGARPEAIYAHVPFCRHKCHYCDFYSIVDARDRQNAYVQRFEEEASACGECVDSSSLKSVFVGGGTPTMLSPEHLARVLRAISEGFPVEPGIELEWTVEANPETVDEACAQALLEGGVNRVSIGCQSFNPVLLEALERHHEPESVSRAISHVRKAGIDRVSLDLIYGIPGSTLQDWADDLEAALALEPSHMSCYCLTFEEGTPLYEKKRQGRIDPLDDELQIEMFQHVSDRLENAGYRQYEISNWARPGEECLHNLLYWRNADWLPLGPAAAGHLQGTRWRNLPRLEDWISSGPFSPIVDLEHSDPRRNTAERLMLGFRLTDGFQMEELKRVLASDPARQESRTATIESAISDGRVERLGDRVRFTASGVLVADGFLADLL